MGRLPSLSDRRSFWRAALSFADLSRRAILRHAARPNPRLKTDATFVTDADLAAERALRAAIARRFLIRSPARRKHGKIGVRMVAPADARLDTPLMRQYQSLKSAYPHAVLFFRLGDFYELFAEDAKLASPVLGVTLTARQGIAMCGVPAHSCAPYIAKLLKAGHKVAVADQMEDPSAAKGLVRREVTRLITPGTVVEDELLDAVTTNYLVALELDTVGWGLACVEVSTGEFWATQALNDSGTRQLLGLLAKLDPAELLVSPKAQGTAELKAALTGRTSISLYDTPRSAAVPAWSKEGPWRNHSLATRAAVTAASYIADTQSQLAGAVTPAYREPHGDMQLDETAIRTLELVSASTGSRKHSLWGVLDRCRTSMGSRRLRGWILHPSTDVLEIERRQNAVEELLDKAGARSELAEVLGEIADVERLLSRLATRAGSPRDLAGLRGSLSQLPALKAWLADTEFCSGLQTLSEALQDAAAPLDEIRVLLDRSLTDRPPIRLSDGGIIRDGFDPKLDELRALKGDSQQFLAELETKERAATGIPSLKVGYTSVFGYYIEVTRAHLSKAPPRFTRKQTLANGERFITPELKELESKILGAEDHILKLEAQLFEKARGDVLERRAVLARFAALIAELDVFNSLAEAAALNDFVKPKVDLSHRLLIEDGRHPVVETTLPAGSFVPNSLTLDGSDPQVIILTGPNMGGKCLTGDSLVFTNQGIVPLNSVEPAGAKTDAFTKVAVSVPFEGKLREASHFFKGAKQKTTRIESRLGYSIQGTPDHKLWVRSADGSEGWKRIAEIVETDYLGIETRADVWGRETKLDIEPLPPHGACKSYPFPARLDEDLGYLFGLLTGDGTLTYRSAVCLSAAEPFISGEFRRIIREKFGYEVQAKKRKADFVITSLQIRHFLAEAGLSYASAGEKVIPDRILRAPTEIVRAFVQGLFDTDGYADTRYGNVSLSTKSLRLARQLQLVLLNFGIISSIKRKISKALGERRYYNVSVYGEDSIRFYETIGFRLDRKNRRGLLQSSIRRPNIGGIPHLKADLKTIQRRIVSAEGKVATLKSAKRVNSIFYTYLPNGRNPSYAKLEELTAFCAGNGVPCPEIDVLLKRRYFYDRVASIRDGGLADVYDLCIPNGHAYVANGIVSHNSTYLRQNALIAVLAQIGSFVPAKSATVGIVDKVLTRIGSQDALARGESTFMVEMNETARILKAATPRSLLILDEVGRGTSTFDGISIAWAVLEHLNRSYRGAGEQDPRGPRVLFATHYFELTKLAELLPGVENANVEAREWTNAEGHTDVVFLHKISPGPADRSFGIHVARLAGLPEPCLRRAREILATLENESKAKAAEPELPLFDEHPVLHALRLLDVNELTPVQALQRIAEWKKQL